MQRTLSVFVVLALFALLTVAPTFAQTPAACNSTHVVAAGDTLAKIAQAVLGKAQDYPLIVAATNAIAQTDNSYHAIDNPDVIEAGWKLCIPAGSSAPASPTVPASSTAVPEQKLTGMVWKWTGTLMNDDSRTTPEDPNKYLLTFLDGGKVSIQADCNRVLGAYTTEGNQLTITPGPGTLVACPPGSLGTEFVRQLSNVSSYFFDKGNLVLEFKFDSGSMTFAPGANGLAGTTWKVVNYNNGKQAVVTLLPDTEISLNFGADGRVSGAAGCNNYTASFDTSGDILHVGALATTFMLCHKPDGVMEQEAQYLAALTSADTFEIAGDTLTIRDGSGAMQVVAKANLPAGLAGTSWNVVNVNNGKQAVVGTIAGTTLTMKFGADNRVNGNAGCNRYSGGFESSGNALKVGALVSTQMACMSPEGVMEQEQQFLTALQNAATFDLNGSTLTIRDAGGAMQVVATANTAAGLAGSAWNVTGVNNGKQALTSLISGSEITLNFGTDGVVSGISGCNNYTGGYEENGDKLKVGTLAGTRKFCESPSGVMDQEQQYLAALQNAATFELDGSTLTIRDADGAMQVVAQR